MPDIIQEFTVKASPERVFDMFARPEGLDRWWTKSSSGEPKEGAKYTLSFGPGYDWQGKVTRCEPPSAFEFLMRDSHPEWDGTRVGCELKTEAPGVTRVRFYHTGWPEENDHWRVSCHCWAMYLRILRRYLEYGETVPFERRLESLMKDITLSVVSDDYEEIGLIVKEVNELANEEGVIATREDVVKALGELVAEGHALAYAYNWDLQKFEMACFAPETVNDLWFYATPQGIRLQADQD